MNRNTIIAIVVIVLLGVLGYATFSTTGRIPPDGARAPAPTPNSEPARPTDPRFPRQ